MAHELALVAAKLYFKLGACAAPACATPACLAIGLGARRFCRCLASVRLLTINCDTSCSSSSSLCSSSDEDSSSSASSRSATTKRGMAASLSSKHGY